MLRFACLFAAAISITTSVRVATAQQADDVNALLLRAGTFRPAPDASLHRTAVRTQAGWYVLQLEGPVTPQRRAALAEVGLRLGEYLPSNAYIVRLPAGFSPKSALERIAFVRWIGAYEGAWKLDPEIGTRQFQTPERRELADRGELALLVTLFEGADTRSALDSLRALPGTIVHYTETVGGNETISLTTRRENAAAFAGLSAVQFVEEAPELTYRNATTRWIIQSNVNGVTPVYTNGITGVGQIAGVLDGRVNVSHCSFVDTVNPIGPSHRKIVAYNTSQGYDQHGTHVAGTVIGDAGADNNTRGIAYGGKLAFNVPPSFTETGIVTALTTHHNQGARVHTNSWGNDGTTAYDGLARGIDVFSYQNEDSLVLFAVTNTSTLRNPENAKNVLAVGASQDTPSQANFCSGGTGPTSDGRRKPEIFAPGCSTNSSSGSGSVCTTAALTGTSMASPAVAGAAMLVRQYYTDGYYPTGAPISGNALAPSAALVKATLLNSAVDMTGIASYPSNQEGWGRALIDDALFFPGDARKLAVLADVRNADGLQSPNVDTYNLQVLGSAERLKVTLVWTEPAAASGASFASINNLDLEVQSPGGAIYRGNVFNTSTGESVTGGSADDRNNVEQVHLSSPQTGGWTVRVRATNVAVGRQGYALVATGEVTPVLPPLFINLPNGAPSVLPPLTSVDFNVEILPGAETLVTGSPLLHVRYDAGAFQTYPLAPLGGNLYRATLPPAGCDATPQFYVSAVGDQSSLVTNPAAAPASTLTALVGETIVLLDDTLESLPGGAGWVAGVPGDTATTGIWVWGDPIGTIAQPEDDHTPPPGVNCFFTGQGTIGGAAGDNDVDGGATTLLSPIIDLSSVADAEVSYWRWYSNSAGAAPNADVFVVDITNNNGASWVNVETVGPTGPGTSGGWINYTFNVASLVTPTAQVRLRFIASDFGAGSLVEAAVDDLYVSRFQCTAVTCMKGDMNGNGTVDGDDIAKFVEILLLGGGTPVEICAGDVTAPLNNAIDPGDVPTFVECLLNGACP